MQNCQDNYSTTFSSYEAMFDYHEEQAKKSQWLTYRVDELQVEPLDASSPLYGNLSAFAPGTSLEAVEDTASNLGLAMQVDGNLYPLRMTAYKSLLDRAKIGGTALPKLSRNVLAEVLNECLKLYSSSALLLIRDEKVSAVHSGDPADYSVLPINELLDTLKAKLDARFPGNEYEGGYCDHSLVSASWKMPDQKEDLLGAYTKLLASQGKTAMADRLMPGIRFMTLDTGLAGKVRSTILLTEGPMKADVIHALTGLTVLAVPGVNSLTQLAMALEDLRSVGVVEIKTAFDMDFATNHHVQNGYNSLLQLLGDMGFTFGTYLWDPRYKGLGDYVWACYSQTDSQ